MCSRLCWSDLSSWACGHRPLDRIRGKTEKWSRNPIRAVKLGHSAAMLCESTFFCHTCYETHLYTCNLHSGASRKLPSPPLVQQTCWSVWFWWSTGWNPHTGHNKPCCCCCRSYVQQDITVTLHFTPHKFSLNTFLWPVCNDFYRLTCVFGAFLCFLALWQCNSTD